MIAARASHSLPPFPPDNRNQFIPPKMGLSGVAERLSKLGDEYCDAPQGSAPIDEWPGRSIRLLEAIAGGLSLFCEPADARAGGESRARTRRSAVQAVRFSWLSGQ